MFMSKISSEKIIIISLIKIMLPHAQPTHAQAALFSQVPHLMSMEPMQFSLPRFKQTK